LGTNRGRAASPWEALGPTPHWKKKGQKRKAQPKKKDHSQKVAMDNARVQKANGFQKSFVKDRLLKRGTRSERKKPPRKGRTNTLPSTLGRSEDAKDSKTKPTALSIPERRPEKILWNIKKWGKLKGNRAEVQPKEKREGARLPGKT